MRAEGTMRPTPNGFGAVAMTVPISSDRAPRRLGPAQAPDPKFRVHPDDHRRVRKAQRAARRITRTRG